MTARLALAVGLAVAGGGCAQILGLDATERQDADMPGACSAELACDTAVDRAVCGRLVDAVTRAPLAVPGATGAACVPGAADGPCAFAIAGQSADELFMATGTPIDAIVVDDCGRFKVEGLVGGRLAVTATPVAPADTIYRRTARTILYNDTGPVEDIEIPIVTNALVTGWETESVTAIPEGLLLFFRNGTTAIDQVIAKINTVAVPQPPTTPFALYFTGSERFGSVVDSTSGVPVLATSTGPTGTAVVVPVDTSPFLLGGSQPGTNCTAINNVQKVLGTLVYIDLTNC